MPADTGRNLVRRTADPTELERIELRLRPLEQGIERNQPIEGSKFRSVFRVDVIECVGERETRCARHVLNHDVGAARHMITEVTRDRARVSVVAATRPETDQDRYGMARIEVGNRVGMSGRDCGKPKRAPATRAAPMTAAFFGRPSPRAFSKQPLTHSVPPEDLLLRCVHRGRANWLQRKISWTIFCQFEI